jgi:hypothetical protein
MFSNSETEPPMTERSATLPRSGTSWKVRARPRSPAVAAEADEDSCADERVELRQDRVLSPGQRVEHRAEGEAGDSVEERAGD